MADPIFKNNNFTKRPFSLELNYLYRDLLFFLTLERIGMNGKLCLLTLYIHDLHCRDINYLYA